MQTDGNFVVYRGSSPANNQGFVWATGTNAPNGNPSFAIMQGDGNFAIYRGSWPGANLGLAWSTRSDFVPDLSPQMLLTNSGSLSIIVNNCKHYQSSPYMVADADHCIPVANENLAYGKPTSQSTTAYGGLSPRAVDGSFNGQWTNSSVTHTDEEAEPWWEVDLRGVFDVTEVTIFNRTDCCADRLGNFHVDLLDANSKVLQTRNFAGVVDVSTRIVFPKTKASRVRIQLNPLPNGTKRYLSLAEVFVKGNLALGRTTLQSSIGWSGHPHRAVDGYTRGNFSEVSVTHTAFEDKPWWQVSLSGEQRIGEVIIWNRTDCCADRLSNFTVELLNSQGAVVSTIPVNSSQEKTVINFGGASGITIRIGLNGPTYLSLAEVEVFAQHSELSHANMNTLLGAGSKYQGLVNLITTPFDQGGLQSSVLPVSIIFDNSLLQPRFTYTYGTPPQSPIGLIIRMNERARPTPQEFWYVIGQSLYRSLRPTDNEFRCQFSDGAHDLMSPTDNFQGNQTDSCLFEEAFLQLFVARMMYGDVSVETLVELYDNKQLPAGETRRALQSKGFTITALTVLEIAHLISSYVSTGDKDVFATWLNAIFQLSSGNANINDALEQMSMLHEVPKTHSGEINKELLEHMPICRELKRVNNQLIVSAATCKNVSKIICEGRHSEGVLESWITQHDHALFNADRACKKESPIAGLRHIRAADAEIAKEFVERNSVFFDGEFYVGISSEHFEECVVMHPITTGSSVYQQADATQDCDVKAQILCENLDNPTDFKVTEHEYALSSADVGCAREFDRFDSNHGLTMYHALTKEKKPELWTLPVDLTHITAMIGTGLIKVNGTVLPKNASKQRLFNKDSVSKALLNTRTALSTSTLDVKDVKSTLTVHSLNVGAGSCHAIQCSSQDPTSTIPKLKVETVLIDCGTGGAVQHGTPYALDRVGVVSYLTASGAFLDPLPTVVITHSDADHISHVIPMINDGVFTPDEILFGGAPGNYGGVLNPLTASHDLNRIVSPNPHPLATVVPPGGIQRTAGFQIKAFPACEAELNLLTANVGGFGTSAEDRNRVSIVSQITVNHGAQQAFSAVLPGDATGTSEGVAIPNLAPHTAAYENRVVMASHHGAISFNSNSTGWVAQNYPTHVIFSAGERHHHPRCEIVRRYMGFVDTLSPLHNIRCDDAITLPNLTNQIHNAFGTRFSGTITSTVLIPADPLTPAEHVFATGM